MDLDIIICVIIACVTLYSIARVISQKEQYSVDDLADELVKAEELAELREDHDALGEDVAKIIDLLAKHFGEEVDHIRETISKCEDETIKGQDGETNTPQPQDCPACGSSDKEKTYHGCMNSWHLEYPETK